MASGTNYPSPQPQDLQPKPNKKKGTDSVVGISEVTEDKKFWRALIGEFMGTLILVFIGCAAIVNLDQDPSHKIQISLTFGLTLASIIHCIGHVSGCHINPAVTISMFIIGNIKLLKTICYIIAQCIGALAGAYLLVLVTPDSHNKTMGVTSVHPDLSNLQGLLMEGLLTFVFVMVIHSVCDSRRRDLKGSAGVAIGLALAACHLCGIQYTGSSLNPARSFGPAVANNAWAGHWVYWIGPLLGGILGGVAYKFLFSVKKGDSESYDF